MGYNIPISKPYFDQKEMDAIVEPLKSGWVVQGANVARFEKLFAEFVGARYAHATTSCTTALHLGLEAMGIGRGDKVIVPSFTYVASANAVEHSGAEVVFCDIDLKTFNLDVQKLDELLSVCVSDECEGRIAIMPVNLFGLCANMPEIIKLAQKYSHSNSHPHKIQIIEDSACGFDGWIGDRHSGTFGDVGCFSFHPRKSICTGEGGMLITDDERLANKVSQLKDHGASKSDIQRHKEKGGSLLPDFTMRGYNYRMTDIQGVLGVCQMDKKEYIMNERRKIAVKYDEALKDIQQFITPYIPKNYKHGYQSYVCIFTDGEDISNLTREQIDRINIKRNIFMEKLEAMTIATRQGTHAVHTLGYYKNKISFKDEDFLMSYAADRLSVALPLYAGMSDEEFRYVISNIKEALK